MPDRALPGLLLLIGGNSSEELELHTLVLVVSFTTTYVFLAWKSVISTLFSSGRNLLFAVCSYYAYVYFGVSLLLMLVFDEMSVVADPF